MARATHYTTLRRTGDRPEVSPATMLGWISQAAAEGRPAIINKDGVRFTYDDDQSALWWPVRAAVVRKAGAL